MDEYSRSLDPIPVATFDRYVAGAATAEDVAEVARWLAADPRRSVLVDGLHPGRSASVDVAFGRVLAKVERGSTSPARRAKFPSGRWGMGLGAALATVVVAVAIPFMKKTRRVNNVTPTRAFETAMAQRATVKLPDGSTVILAPASRLEYANSFGSSDRTLRLTGEAVFTVSPDRRAPFIVRTANAETRVLGTQFLVRRYVSDSIVRVVVADGRVAVASATNHQTTVLGARQAVHVLASGAIIADSGIDVPAAMGWTEGRLTYRRTPLRDVLADIERMYDVEIRVPDVIGRERYTGTIDQALASDAVAMLAAVANARVVRHGRIFTLTER